VDGPAPRRWQLQFSNRRPWRRTAIVAVSSAVVVLALGGPLGLLWAWLAPNVPVIDTGRDIVVNDPSPEEYIAADGWFALLGLGFGLLVAVVAWLALRRDRGPFLLLGVVLGTAGAGYYVAPWIGELIGKPAYQHWRDTAAQGATYMAPPEVHSTGPMLVPAFAAAIVLTLMAGWSNDPDLDNPGAKPGYGPNAEGAYGPDALYGPGGAYGPNPGGAYGPNPGAAGGYGPNSGAAGGYGPDFDAAGAAYGPDSGSAGGYDPNPGSDSDAAGAAHGAGAHGGATPGPASPNGAAADAPPEPTFGDPLGGVAGTESSSGPR